MFFPSHELQNATIIFLKTPLAESFTGCSKVKGLTTSTNDE
jgi:hypothetical protein